MAQCEANQRSVTQIHLGVTIGCGMSRVKSRSHSRKPKSVIITRPLVLDGQLSELWSHERDKLFAELRRYQIPAGILNAVEGFGWHRPVRWVTSTGAKPEKGDKAWPVVMPRQKLLRPTAEEKAAYEEALSLFESAFEVDGDLLPSNAGEVLAYCLVGQLKLLDGRPASPVRGKGRLARSKIAAAAIMLLLDSSNQPPGPNLINLLRALLNVEAPDAKAMQAFWARHVAIQILAQDPARSLRAVAREVGASAISLSRWSKEPDFIEEVELCRRRLSPSRIAALKKGDWIRP
jgi:hypothetical protein